jgi:hypothetical protein
MDAVAQPPPAGISKDHPRGRACHTMPSGTKGHLVGSPSGDPAGGGWATWSLIFLRAAPHCSYYRLPHHTHEITHQLTIRHKTEILIPLHQHQYPKPAPPSFFREPPWVAATNRHHTESFAQHLSPEAVILVH